jgi:hypothetical protein
MKVKRVIIGSATIIASLGTAALAAQGGRGAGASGFGTGRGGSMSDMRGAEKVHSGGRPEDVGKNSEMGRGKSDQISQEHGKSPAELLNQNTKLSAKLESLLPAGTNVQDAAKGFDNLGQFVASVHVSKNLGIPFGQLKEKVTGPSSLSLGEAIHSLKPGVNARKEAIRGNELAIKDMEQTLPHR